MAKDEMELLAEKISKKAVEKIKEKDGGNFLQCLQCGKCAGSCAPEIRKQMDLAPWRLIHLLTLGGEEEMGQVLTSTTIWLCVACSACVSRCPMKINTAKIMEVLRSIVMKYGGDFLDIKKIPEDILEEMPQMGIIDACKKFTK